jgi:hypothetical protein
MTTLHLTSESQTSHSGPDYHGNTATFAPGNRINHIADDGTIIPGTVRTVDGDLLEVAFDDGEEGWENISSCFLSADDA